MLRSLLPSFALRLSLLLFAAPEGLLPFAVVFGLVLPLLSRPQASPGEDRLGMVLAGLCCWGLTASLARMNVPLPVTALLALAAGLFLRWVVGWIMSPLSPAGPEVTKGPSHDR